MSEPEYLKWSPERKQQYANKRLEEMRAENVLISKRYEVTKRDKKAAERKNSSVTNAKKVQRPEISPPLVRSTHERDLPRYSREWDRDKVDWNKNSSLEVDDYHHKRRQNYKAGEYEKKIERNYKNYTRPSNHTERHERTYDNSVEKRKKHIYYSNDQRNKSRYYGSSQSRHHVHQSREKYKKYYPVDTKKHHNRRRSSSSSTDSDCRNKKVNKIRMSNRENSALWHSDRVTEDKDKHERTLKWVKSMQIENVEDQENTSTEEDNNNISSKKEYNFATTPNKCLDEYDPFPQISSIKPQKLVYEKQKGTTIREESKIMQQKLSYKKEPCRISYTKFDRMNRSVHSSDNSSSDECNLDKTKSEENSTVDLSKVESNNNLKSKNHDYDEKDNGRSEKINSECNSKTQNYSCGRNKCKGERLPVSDSKQSAKYEGSYPIKKPYVAGKFSSNVSREYNYNERCNFANKEKERKKGFKTKRDSDTNPQYYSPDSLKSDHINRQRRFDKQQSDNSWNIPADKNKGLRSEKYDHNKKSNFSVVPLNQDDYTWGNIKQPYNEDDDGIWAHVDQSARWAPDFKWTTSEESETEKKNELKNPWSSSEEAESFKVKNSKSDDCGWSTVEEGEILSDYPEENGEDVKNKD